MAITNIDVTATVSPSTVSGLAAYAPGYYAARGYTELWAEDWASYADSIAVRTAYAFGSSSGSNLPRAVYISKYDADPIFPNRMIEGLMPYSDDASGATGSAGRQWLLTKSWTLNDNVWRRWIERYGGSSHPVAPSTSDFSHIGTYPAGGDGQKEVFWGGSFTRIGWERVGANRLVVADWGFTNTETKISDAQRTQLAPAGTASEGATVRNGAHAYEWTEHFWTISTTLCIIRRWRAQIDAGGLYNPQAPLFTGHVYTNPSGGTFTGTTGWVWRLNKNQTTRDDGLSTTSWDVEDTFKTSNSETGLTLRNENTKPWRGMRVYQGPMLAITGGDGKPFTDHLGNNLDLDGRDDVNWPAGAP